MWTSKYRPQKLDDIIGNKEIITSIKAMMPEIPHMLFKGPPGVGKTTTALAIVNELNCDYLEINASHDRGIDTVRTTIRNFVSNSSMGCKFKILILDEADDITPDAQAALRRLMEKHSNNCRFIFTCNRPQRIIEPLQSRCQGGIFEFLPIVYSDFKEGILKILTKESITITEDALQLLHKKSNGDMRVIDKLYNISCQTKNITIDHIQKLEDDESWKNVMKEIQNGNFTGACKIVDVKHVEPLFRNIMESALNDEIKAKVTRYFAEYEFRKRFSETNYIQLYALISYLIPLYAEKTEIKSLAKKKVFSFTTENKPINTIKDN